MVIWHNKDEIVIIDGFLLVGRRALIAFLVVAICCSTSWNWVSRLVICVMACGCSYILKLVFTKLSNFRARSASYARCYTTSFFLACFSSPFGVIFLSTFQLQILKLYLEGVLMPHPTCCCAMIVSCFFACCGNLSHSVNIVHASVTCRMNFSSCFLWSSSLCFQLCLCQF